MISMCTARSPASGYVLIRRVLGAAGIGMRNPDRRDMPSRSVKRSLQIEPPNCGMRANGTLVERAIELWTHFGPRIVQSRSGSHRNRPHSPAVAARPMTRSMPCSEKCRLSAGRMSSASVPAMYRNWQCARAHGAMALTGLSGIA